MLFDLLPVLWHQVLKRNVGDGGILLLVLEGIVSDQRGDVLLDLCQVLDYVVLCESDAVLVVLSLSNAKVELGLLEAVYHLRDTLLDLGESGLGCPGSIQTKAVSHLLRYLLLANLVL